MSSNTTKICPNHPNHCPHCEHVREELTKRIRNEAFQHMALKITKDPHLAEEVVQLTATRLLSRPHLYKRGNFDGFIRVMMHRIFLNMLRGQKRIDYVDEVQETQNTISEAFERFDQDKKILIRQMYKSLNIKEQELFMLIYQGVKHKEIASLLNINLNTCHGRIRRMMMKLRQRFA